MGDLSALRGWEGKWVGENKLWVTGETVRASDSFMGVEPVTGSAGGKFLRVGYRWHEGERPQDGSFVFNVDEARGMLKALWKDTWHTGEKGMELEGRVMSGGVADVRGSYAAPPGADWGWRITIERAGEKGLIMRMFNISPEGREELAVEAVYERV